MGSRNLLGLLQDSFEDAAFIAGRTRDMRCVDRIVSMADDVSATLPVYAAVDGRLGYESVAEVFTSAADNQDVFSLECNDGGDGFDTLVIYSGTEEGVLAFNTDLGVCTVLRGDDGNGYLSGIGRERIAETIPAAGGADAVDKKLGVVRRFLDNVAAAVDLVTSDMKARRMRLQAGMPDEESVDEPEIRVEPDDVPMDVDRNGDTPSDVQAGGEAVETVPGAGAVPDADDASADEMGFDEPGEPDGPEPDGGGEDGQDGSSDDDVVPTDAQDEAQDAGTPMEDGIEDGQEPPVEGEEPSSDGMDDVRVDDRSIRPDDPPVEIPVDGDGQEDGDAEFLSVESERAARHEMGGPVPSVGSEKTWEEIAAEQDAAPRKPSVDTVSQFPGIPRVTPDEFGLYRCVLAIRPTVNGVIVTVPSAVVDRRSVIGSAVNVWLMKDAGDPGSFVYYQVMKRDFRMMGDRNEVTIRAHSHMQFYYPGPEHSSESTSGEELASVYRTMLEYYAVMDGSADEEEEKDGEALGDAQDGVV